MLLMILRDLVKSPKSANAPGASTEALNPCKARETSNWDGDVAKTYPNNAKEVINSPAPKGSLRPHLSRAIPATRLPAILVRE